MRRRQSGQEHGGQDREIASDDKRDQTIEDSYLEAVVHDAHCRRVRRLLRGPRTRASLGHDSIHRPAIEVPMAAEERCKGYRYNGH